MFDPNNQTDAVASGMGNRLSGEHYKSCEIISSVLDALGKNLQSIHSGTFQRTDCSDEMCIRDRCIIGSFPDYIYSSRVNSRTKETYD